MEGGGRCDGDGDHFLLLMPEDVVIGILYCLPVISLMRFKSVCKSWLSIIETPLFINLHASKLGGGGSGSGSSLLFGEDLQKKNRGNFFMLSGEEFEVFKDLGRPSSSKPSKFCLKACCNGIICLHDFYTRNVVLWNPAIKQSRLVPKPNSYDDYYILEEVIAFGVDIKTKDYKVLLITTFRPRQMSDYEYDDDEDSQSQLARRVHVYSLSTDSWRCIDDDDDTLSAADPKLLQIDSDNGSLCLNGSYFFIAYCLDEYFRTMPSIMSFDFTEEIFITIQPPYDWARNSKARNWKVYFIPFDEKIALVDVKSDALNRWKCDVWLLNELHNGVKEESWTKFYTFGHSYGSYRSPIALRCIANNGQFAVIYCIDREDRGVHVWKLQLFNLITRETNDLLSGVDLNVSIYKPSLVKIGGSGASTNEKCK